MPSIENTVNVDYYKELGLRKSATKDEIVFAYRKLALKLHPLKTNNDVSAAKKFHLVSESFDVLNDAMKKAVFDLYGTDGLIKGVKGNVLEEYEGNYMFPVEKSLEVFKGFFGTENPFEAVFATIPNTQTFVSDYRDVYREKQYPTVGVTLEDLYNGVTKPVTLGIKSFSSAGEVQTIEKKFALNIKKGWKDGTRIVFPREGDQLSNGFRDDVIITLQQEKHSIFSRVGDDLHVSQNITLKQALTTANVSVKTLDGRQLDFIIGDIISPSFTKTVHNEGMPSCEVPDARGNMVIKFNVEFPSYLNNSQKEAIAAAL